MRGGYQAIEINRTASDAIRIGFTAAGCRALVGMISLNSSAMVDMLDAHAYHP